MSMTLDAEALPDVPPPMADLGGVAIPSRPPSFDFDSIPQIVPPGFPAPAAAPVPSTVAPAVDLAALARDAASIKRNEMAASTRIRAEEDARLAKHREMMEQRFAQTGVNPDDFKPFDNEAARERYKTDPIESFGSLGSVFAIIASQFTNRPMENAMYGAAAAMNAIKEGNDKEYERAYKTWQDNTNLAIKRQNAQHQSYNDAMSMVKTDMGIAQDRMKQSAAMYGDQQMLKLLDAGLWQDAIKLVTDRENLTLKIAENEPKLALDLYKTQMLRNDPRSKMPPGSPEHNAFIREYQELYGPDKHDATAEHSRQVIAEYNSEKHGSSLAEYYREQMDKWFESKSGSGTRKLSESQKAFKEEIKAKFGREPTSDEWVTHDQRSRATATKDSEFIKRRTTEILVEREAKGEPISDTQAEKIAREELTRTRTNPGMIERLSSIERAKKDWLEKHPEAGGVVPTEIENQIRANAHRSVTNATIDDRTARLIAEQVVAGRYQVMAGLGHGGVGTANRAKVLALVTDISEERNLNGADIARQAIEYQATGAGARSLAQLEARTTGAITKAQATAPRVLEISDQIDRTRYPKINDIIIAAQRNVGGEKVVKLGVAVETFINNYAMALGGGSSVMTDSSKQHARALLELGYSKGQMHAAIDQMMIEMESELEGIKRGLSTYLEPPKKGAATTFRPPANWEYSNTRQQYRDPSGVLYDKNGKKVQ